MVGRSLLVEYRRRAFYLVLKPFLDGTAPDGLWCSRRCSVIDGIVGRVEVEPKMRRALSIREQPCQDCAADVICGKGLPKREAKSGQIKLKFRPSDLIIALVCPPCVVVPSWDSLACRRCRQAPDYCHTIYHSSLTLLRNCSAVHHCYRYISGALPTVEVRLYGVSAYVHAKRALKHQIFFHGAKFKMTGQTSSPNPKCDHRSVAPRAVITLVTRK